MWFNWASGKVTGLLRGCLEVGLFHVLREIIKEKA